ncbi:cytochrome P450 [Nemania sp. FL0916]|nr:cytochrome P450 [Nemania sp. FL0916]
MASRRRLHLVAYENHEKHGSVIRMAPNRLLFNTATAFRGIYQDDVRITKANVYELITRNGVYSVFNTLDRDLHRAKRKIVSQPFSERAMKSFMPALLPHVDVCLKQLLESAGKPVDMTQQMSYLAVDVVGQLALGYDLRTQTSAENRFFPRALTVSFFVSNISLHLPPFHKVHTNRVFDYLLWETRERFTRLLERMVGARLALPTHAVPDLFSFVAEGLPAEASQTQTRDSAIWKEAMVFLVAGGDTVATAMTATFFYLSRNPACYARLADEVRAAFASGRDITVGPALAGCKYLRACIDESLRMSPPISANLWRKQVDDDDDDDAPLFIDGQYIPRGTLFGVNVYALSHNADIFPDPFVFNPQRWLDADDESEGEAEGNQGSETEGKKNKPMLEAFAAFGIGPRNCVGKPLAYLETSIVIAKTLWYFDFERAPGLLGTVGEASSRGRPQEFCTQEAFNSSHEGHT